jgi:hypothetical protein
MGVATRSQPLLGPPMTRTGVPLAITSFFGV